MQGTREQTPQSDALLLSSKRTPLVGRSSNPARAGYGALTLAFRRPSQLNFTRCRVKRALPRTCRSKSRAFLRLTRGASARSPGGSASEGESRISESTFSAKQSIALHAKRRRMRIGIIGAGPAGLAAAYDLARQGHEVTVFEASENFGGLAGGFREPHWEWSLEKFYHHWFTSDRAILGLIRELGWQKEVLFPRPFTVLYHKGEFYPADSLATAARFFLPRFPLHDVVRFGIVGLYLRLTPWWRPLEKVPASKWLRRWAGNRIYESVWEPMLVGKFGEENVDVVNMAWFWARIKSRTTRLGTFVGGFQAFFDRFGRLLQEQGVRFYLKTTVTGVTPASDGRLAVEALTEQHAFDAVICTSSPALTARMIPALPETYAEKLRSLRSLGAVVLIVALDRPLTRYYWHNLPKSAGFPFLALVEHTNFVPAEHFGGDHLVYCGDYLDPSHEYFRLSREELLDRFLAAFPRFNPHFERSWVRGSWLWRTTYAQPIPPVCHSQNIPDLRTPIRGLYFASMSQVYPWDRGTNYAVALGRKVAAMLLEDLSK